MNLFVRLFTCLLFYGFAVTPASEPLRVCTTVPDLGELVRAVGGDDVVVTVFVRGGDDPHFVEARPSFTKALSRADLLVVVGLELEIGWIPVLQEQARNARIAVGGAGYVEAASVIDKLGIPPPNTDRSHGDVHQGGNPHFLTDPVNGLRVARLIADRLIELIPERREHIENRWRAFAARMAIALFGIERGGDMAAAEVVIQAERETLEPSAKVGGWFALLRPAAGMSIVADHDLWPYVVRRFGLVGKGFLEPKPGIAPTTRHLAALVELMKKQHVRGILTTPYFDAQYARLVAERTGAVIIPLAHQVGALADAQDYLTTIERNVRALAAGLTEK